MMHIVTPNRHILKSASFISRIESERSVIETAAANDQWQVTVTQRPEKPKISLWGSTVTWLGSLR